MTITLSRNGRIFAQFDSETGQAVTRPAPRRKPSDEQTEDRRAREGRVGNE